MGWSLKHLFHSPKTDGPDSTLVKPSNWNDEHVLTVDVDGVVLGKTAGSGAGPIETIPMSSLIPAGFIMPYAGATVPSGWALCYGQLFNRLANAALFAAIGTTYGAGDGSTTFNGPDFRGVALVGKSNMGGPDRGNLGGAGTLGAYIGGQAQGPVGVNVGNYFGGGGWTAQGYTTGAQSMRVYGNTGNTSSGPQYGVVGGGPSVGDHSHWFDSTFNTNGENLTVNVNNFGASGGTNSFSIVQPSVAINFLIKV